MDWDTNSQFIDIKQYLLDVPPGHGVRFLMDFTIILNLENLSTLLINFRQVKKYVVPKVLDPNIVGLAEKVFSSNKSMHWSDFEVLKCRVFSLFPHIEQVTFCKKLWLFRVFRGIEVF